MTREDVMQTERRDRYKSTSTRSQPPQVSCFIQDIDICFRYDSMCFEFKARRVESEWTVKGWNMEYETVFSALDTLHLASSLYYLGL